MTDATVPVPIDLLQKIKDRYPVATAEFDYLTDLVALIPDSPKVGDTVEYERRLDLPFGTVVADKDGDLWVHLETGYAYINITSHEQVEEEPGVGRAPASYYGPFTIVYLRD